MQKELPQSLKDVAVFPEDPRYDKVRSNDFKVGQPKIVILAETEEQVIETINYTASIRQDQNEKFPLSVRCGGHGLGPRYREARDGGTHGRPPKRAPWPVGLDLVYAGTT